MAHRYQNGHLRKAKRKRGPDVWEFLWRETLPGGRSRQRTLTVGTIEQFRTKRDAFNHIQMLRANINRNIEYPVVTTFGALVDHYRQTELLTDNRTEKTKATYLV